MFYLLKSTRPVFGWKKRYGATLLPSFPIKHLKMKISPTSIELVLSSRLNIYKLHTRFTKLVVSLIPIPTLADYTLGPSNLYLLYHPDHSRARSVITDLLSKIIHGWIASLICISFHHLEQFVGESILTEQGLSWNLPTVPPFPRSRSYEL